MDKSWKIFCGDEFSINMRIKGSKVWFKIGCKPSFPTQTKKGEVHIFGALNNKRGKVITLPAKKIDTFGFIKFLKKLLYYHNKVFLIIDNASWHRSKIVKKFINENENRLAVDYFPPYSPEYNPAEQCWKRVKNDLITTKLFLSAESMEEQVVNYFNKRYFSSLKLELFLGS